MSAYTSCEVLLGGQHRVHARRVDPGAHRDGTQLGVVGDVARFGEVRRQQRLLYRSLEGRAALLEREVQQPVGVDGVRALGVVQPVDQALLGRHRLHAVDHPGAALGAAAVLAAEALRDRLGRHRGRAGVELEGAPDDLHLVRELREGGLEAALADVAPGADDVGPDLDNHVRPNRAALPVCSRDPRHRTAHPPPLAGRRGAPAARHPQPGRGGEVARRRRAAADEGPRRGAREDRALPRAQRDAAARLLGDRDQGDRGGRRLGDPAGAAEGRGPRGRDRLAPAPRLVGSGLRQRGGDGPADARFRRTVCRRSSRSRTSTTTRPRASAARSG